MDTTTNGGTIGKIIRIQHDEKILLFQLREIYGNDYKKYFECIRRGSNIPPTIRRIYKLLDERKAYRRISDYFHRDRIARKTERSKSIALKRSYHRSSTRPNIQLSQSISTTKMDHETFDEDDNTHQQSDNSTITNNSAELNDIHHRIHDNIQDTQPSSSINSIPQQEQNLSLINNVQQQSINSQSDLLSVRASIQKALSDLDRIIISKYDSIPEEHNGELQISSIEQTNDHSHPKLDDFVRSLSNVVNQQQENVGLIITESSSLLADGNRQLENFSIQDTIKHTVERLNILVDRGHSIYEKIEKILSQF